MRVLGRGVVAVLLLLVMSVPALASAGIVRVAVTGADVPLRAAPQGESRIIARLRAHDVFFAEEWPVANADDGSQWYVVLFAVGKHSEKPLSAAGGPVGEKIRPLFSAAWLDARSVRVLPLEADDWKTLAVTPYGRGSLPAGKSAAEQRQHLPAKAVQDDGYSFVQQAGECIGANLPQIIRLWGQGEVKREYSSADVEHFDQELFRTRVKLSGLTLDILEDCQDGLIVMNRIELTRQGADLCGLRIGETTQQQVKAILGAPRSQKKTPNGTEWLYEPEGEHFHSLRIRFAPQGSLSGITVRQWSAV